MAFFRLYLQEIICLEKHITLVILFISSMGLAQDFTLGALVKAGLSDSRLMDAWQISPVKCVTKWC